MLSLANDGESWDGRLLWLDATGEGGQTPDGDDGVQLTKT